MKSGLFEIFAQRNPAPRRIAEKPERTRVPPRRAIAAKWAWSRRAIVTYHNRAHTRIYPTNTYTSPHTHTHIYTCTPPVGSIVKERCGWQEWKAHARASGSSARATGPSARAREHARAALTRTCTHTSAVAAWPECIRSTHTRAREMYTHMCTRHTCERPSSANSSADFFGPSRSLRSQNPALALSRARARVQAFLCEVIFS